MRIFTTASICLLLMPMIGTANADDHVHGAHAHGIGHLDVVIENKTVSLELTVPGADIVGLEHAAESAADRSKVEKALKILEAESNFKLPEQAKCRRQHSKSSYGSEHQHAHGEKEHRNVTLHSTFECDNPAALKNIRVELFEAFPALREIEVRAITPRGQTAAELTSDKRQVKF